MAAKFNLVQESSVYRDFFTIYIKFCFTDLKKCFILLLNVNATYEQVGTGANL